MSWYNPKTWARKKEKSMQSPDGGWTTIFDWMNGAFQSHSALDSGEDSILSNPTVFSCLSLIQNDIGKLKPVIQKYNSGIWSASKHPADDVLKKPNNYQNHIQFVQCWINSKLNHGNTYGLKIRSQNNYSKIIGVHILDPLKVKPLIADNGDVYYKIDEDRLATITVNNTVPASEIMHDRGNCFYHPLIGLSPIFAAAAASKMGNTIINNSENFFANGANPSGILTAPGSIGDDTAKRLKDSLQEGFTGKNSGKVIVVGDGLKYASMRMNSTDAQLLEQLGWSDEKICSCYHVPAHMAGVGAAPSYNNIEALSLQYYSQCLQILIESMEACIDAGLGIESGYRTQLDLDGLFRMDQSTLMDTVSKSKGWATLDEGRKRLGLPPIKGGDTVYMQQQDYSVAALAERDKHNPLGVKPEMIALESPASEELEDSAKYLAYTLQKEIEVEYKRA